MVRQRGSHASLAVWVGGNEVESSFRWWVDLTLLSLFRVGLAICLHSIGTSVSRRL